MRPLEAVALQQVLLNFQHIQRQKLEEADAQRRAQEAAEAHEVSVFCLAIEIFSLKW